MTCNSHNAASTLSRFSRTQSQAVRSHLMAEMIETERSFQLSLETMLAYKAALCTNNLHAAAEALFANIDSLVVFQAALMQDMDAAFDAVSFENAVGELFLSQEPSFDVFFPFCENYERATNFALANANMLKEFAPIIALHELQAYLIRPVQRLMKYPQLLNELVKLSESDEITLLKAGLDASRRVTAKLNESKREDENRRLRSDLLQNLEESALKPKLIGNLLLSEYLSLAIHSNEQYQELHTYLFENAILCCRRETKLTRRAISLNLFKPASPEPNIHSFILIKTIKTSSILRVEDTSDPSLSIYSIDIHCRDKVSTSKLSINFRNSEQLTLWTSRIEKMMEIYQNIRNSVYSKDDSPSLRSSRNSVSSNKSSDDSGDLHALGSFRSISPFFGGADLRRTLSNARSSSANAFSSHADYRPSSKMANQYSPSSSAEAPTTAPLPELIKLMDLAYRSLSEPAPFQAAKVATPIAHNHSSASKATENVHLPRNDSLPAAYTQEPVELKYESNSSAEITEQSRRNSESNMSETTLIPSSEGDQADSDKAEATKNRLSRASEMSSESLSPAKESETEGSHELHQAPTKPTTTPTRTSSPPLLKKRSFTSTAAFKRQSLLQPPEPTVTATRPRSITPFLRVHLYYREQITQLSMPTFGAAFQDLQFRISRKLRLAGDVNKFQFVLREQVGSVDKLECESDFCKMLLEVGQEIHVNIIEREE
ncbi:hypothetical protein HDU81_009773 [Chytriomyces hyalinus]|nr:hypothetical protein HDU81_009773 [Chytriomyces hyalinus]